MEVYEKLSRKNYSYECPEDMEKILGYLCDNGILHVTGKIVERLYEVYSHEHGAGWLEPCDAVIEDFADWLADSEL